MHEKRFDVTRRTSRIIEQPPPHGAVAKPLLPHLAHGLFECMRPFGFDKIIDHHEHGSVVGLRLNLNVRLGPVASFSGSGMNTGSAVSITPEGIGALSDIVVSLRRGVNRLAPQSAQKMAPFSC